MKPSELLAKPGAWCQGAYAKDASGHDVDPLDHAAVSWCLSGACLNAGIPWYDFGRKLRKVIGSIPTWNDAPGRTQSEVVQILQSVGL